ncbi:MAG: universal stress protein [Anaerolineae bacterium]|jgi:hypothetical protein|nr:universal stress protein [Anaerolineae bacterium]
MTAYLALSNVSLDPLLVRRLPRALALHHLALVVAEDEDSVTVALADPANPTARQRIESVLGHNLALVRSDPEAIRAALLEAWSHDAARGGVALGGSVPLRPMLTAYAQRVILPALPFLAFDSHLVPRLLLSYDLSPQRREMVVLRPEASVWLCLDPARPIQHIVVAIRSGAPDWQAAEWAGWLARAHGAQVTLLAATGISSTPILSTHAAYLNPTDPRGAHVADLALVLQSMGREGRLKVREGTFVAAVVGECLDSRPDLLVIGAEQAGQQAAQILGQAADTLGNLLVLKA